MRYGRLVVLRQAPNKLTKVCWHCACDCGNFTTVLSDSLGYGSSKSCGCLKTDSSCAKTHGLSQTRIYGVWANMRARCTNKKADDWDYYGGRGITVCERWTGFENFYTDMGHPKPGDTLERVDVNGHYEPRNCVWASIFVQANNKRSNHFVDVDGIRMSIAQAARHHGIPATTVYWRKNHNKPQGEWFLPPS